MPPHRSPTEEKKTSWSLDTSGLDAALNAALNEVAKARPAKPLSAIAQVLPPPTHPTPTLPAASNDDMAALRRTWIAMHGIQEGVSIY